MRFLWEKRILWGISGVSFVIGGGKWAAAIFRVLGTWGDGIGEIFRVWSDQV